MNAHPVRKSEFVLPIFLHSSLMSGVTLDLTVITATRQSTRFLADCLKQFDLQELGGIHCEHIVVADGPDECAKYYAERAGARYFALTEPVGQWGDAA